MVVFPDPRENHAQSRDQGHRKKHTWNTAELLADQHAKQNQHGMHFHASAHQERVQDVVLEYAIKAQKKEYPEQVRVAVESGHQKNHRGSGKRANHRDDFQRGRDSRQEERIRDAHCGEKCQI